MKQYIGDGVYVEWNGFDFKVYTDNGYGATNVIYLGDAEIDGLVNFRKRTYAQLEKGEA